jgi:hypothetical protein
VAGFEDEDSDSTELAEVLPDEAFARSAATSIRKRSRDDEDSPSDVAFHARGLAVLSASEIGRTKGLTSGTRSCVAVLATGHSPPLLSLAERKRCDYQE